MQCPKCNQTNVETAIECIRCGVIFAKVKMPRPRPAPGELRPEKPKRGFLAAAGRSALYTLAAIGALVVIMVGAQMYARVDARRQVASPRPPASMPMVKQVANDPGGETKERNLLSAAVGRIYLNIALNNDVKKGSLQLEAMPKMVTIPKGYVVGVKYKFTRPNNIVIHRNELFVMNRAMRILEVLPGKK